jgi:hypothetical protein
MLQAGGRDQGIAKRHFSLPPKINGMRSCV